MIQIYYLSYVVPYANPVPSSMWNEASFKPQIPHPLIVTPSFISHSTMRGSYTIENMPKFEAYIAFIVKEGEGVGEGWDMKCKTAGSWQGKLKNGDGGKTVNFMSKRGRDGAKFDFFLFRMNLVQFVEGNI